MGWMEVKCVRSSDADTKRGNEKKKKIRLFWRHEGQTDRQTAKPRMQARQRTRKKSVPPSCPPRRYDFPLLPNLTLA